MKRARPGSSGSRRSRARRLVDRHARAAGILGQFDVRSRRWRGCSPRSTSCSRLVRCRRRTSHDDGRGSCSAAGVVVFAAASLACGLATSFDLLVGAAACRRGGAASSSRLALDLLARRSGATRRRCAYGSTAGVLGAALGPAVGGILTQRSAGSAIFLVQVPAGPRAPRRAPRRSRAPTCAGAGRAPAAERERGSAPRRRRPRRRALPLVLLLVNGWGMSPAAAGIVVTIMPLRRSASARLPAALARRRSGASACGVVLVAGGLAALALLPRAGWAWTIPPQLLVGAGVGLDRRRAHGARRRRPGRSGRARRLDDHRASRGRRARAAPARAGPDLRARGEPGRGRPCRRRRRARQPHSAARQARLAQDVLVEVDRGEEGGKLPDVARRSRTGRTTTSGERFVAALQDQLDRAVTNAFSRPFLLAARSRWRARPAARSGFGGGPDEARAPAPRGVRRSSPWSSSRISLSAARPTSRLPVADPCRTREWRKPGWAVRVARADRAPARGRRRVRARRLARGSRARASQRGRSRRVRRRERHRSHRCRAGDPHGLVRAVDDAEAAGALRAHRRPVRKAVDSVATLAVLTLEPSRRLPAVDARVRGCGRPRSLSRLQWHARQTR